MRKIIKILSVLIILLFSRTLVMAQLPIPVGIPAGIPTALPIGLPIPKVVAFGNFTYAIPNSGAFTEKYNNGTGFEVGGGFGLGKTMIIASTGLINYTPKKDGVSNYKVVPIKVGIRRYIVAGLFLNAQIGMAKQTFTNTLGQDDNRTGFLYEFGAGIKVLHIIELGADYTGYTTGDLSGISTAKVLLVKAGFVIKI